MLNKEYQNEVNWLFLQFPSYQKIGSKAYKPTLDNILKICQRIGNPQNKLKFIHVAGSNGKGSTCSMLSSILTESGYKVGLFTSPHITDFSERIRINGIQISKQFVLDFIQRIKKEPFDFSPSFFEVTFAMAIEFFHLEECDICVIETGLGGRLDATNIIQPILSVITNISLEHTAILGNTVEEIAIEKAGIIKSKTPIVCGKMEKSILSIINEVAKEKNSPLFNGKIEDSTKYTIPLLGEHQRDNFETVLKSLMVLNQKGFKSNPDSIQKGLNHLHQNTGFSARLQIISENPLLIFDVSHNFDGIKTTLEAISKINFKNLKIIYGTSNDKDLNSILELFPKNSDYYFTEFDSERSMQISDIKEITKGVDLKNKQYFISPRNALDIAIEQSNEEDLILVFGSFFLISTFF